MKVEILLLCTLSLLSSGQLNDRPSHIIVGGFTTKNPLKMSGWAKSADQYIRKAVPEIREAKLIEYQEQVVAGINYKFTYEIDQQDKTYIVQATVYRNLHGLQRITRLFINEVDSSKRVLWTKEHDVSGYRPQRLAKTQTKKRVNGLVAIEGTFPMAVEPVAA